MSRFFYNKVIISGNLTVTPELRYTPNGTAVTNLSVAINRSFTTKTGEKKEVPCFVNVVVWARTAENCTQFLEKGQAVFIEGRLQSSSWEQQDGTKRSKLEVIAENVHFLDKSKSTGGGVSSSNKTNENEDAFDDDMNSEAFNSSADEETDEVPF